MIKRFSISEEKSAKYDRQLRLWGNHGQSDLETARVCLINATIVGTEILKSMILPGVGYFNIIDDKTVTQDDIDNNFFIKSDQINENRAKAATINLCEMNSDVVGEYSEENIDFILSNRVDYLKSFNVIIATNLNKKTAIKLAEYSWVEEIPLVIVKSFGLIGYIRVASKEHTIFEAHPDNELPDLRLDCPFDELASYCDSIDLQSLTQTEHSHLPSLIILYKYLQEWKKMNNVNRIPVNYKEKQQFKQLIQSGILRNEDGVPKVEENFDEAIKNVNNSIFETKIPKDITELLFNNEKCLNLNEKSNKFWIIVRAIKEFTENEGNGKLPLRGSIPDMISDSDKFISLQNVYKTKAQHDCESIMTRIERLLIQNNKPNDYITEQTVKLFCKISFFIF
jgi:NEDD8-activating enzyme E1 regulatory subunit